jgi:hypothetical protein
LNLTLPLTVIKAYNQEVQLNNVKHAMVSHLQGKPNPVFGDVLAAHFGLKAVSILRDCQKWCDEGLVSAEYVAAVAELRTLLLAIAPEAGSVVPALVTPAGAFEGGGGAAGFSGGGSGGGGGVVVDSDDEESIPFPM